MPRPQIPEHDIPPPAQGLHRRPHLPAHLDDVGPHVTGRFTHSQFGVCEHRAGRGGDVIAAGRVCVTAEPEFRGAGVRGEGAEGDVGYDEEGALGWGAVSVEVVVGEEGSGWEGRGRAWR